MRLWALTEIEDHLQLLPGAALKAKMATHTEPIPGTMFAIVTTGNGGVDKLEIRQDHPVPQVGDGEVLVRVLAAGVNNTEINTRLGWYSKTVSVATNDQSSIEEDHATQKDDGGWDKPTPFPLIQGTDCCGVVVKATSVEEHGHLLGKRVIIRSCMRGPDGFNSPENVWIASDFDGAFAQFVKVPGSEVFPVDCDWTDEELGSIPCAYGSTENMINRSRVSEGDHVLVQGASGGIGTAAIQLAKRRGAKVTAVCGSSKANAVLEIGADRVVAARFGDPGWKEQMVDLEDSVDVVIDNVGGPGFPDVLSTIKRGGRYASSGAVGGPIVDLDMRTMYLKDITLIGCTAWDEPVFPSLVGYIERGEIKPIVDKIFPLEKIGEAQTEFLERRHIGKFVLVPPPLSE